MNDASGPANDLSWMSPPRAAPSAPAPGYDFNSISTRKDYSGYQEQEVLQSGGNDWNGLAIASLILGIVGFLTGFIGLIIPCIGWLPLPMAVIGLGLGFASYRKMKGAGSKESFGIIIAGLVLNGILLILSILGIIALLMLFMLVFSSSAAMLDPSILLA